MKSINKILAVALSAASLLAVACSDDVDRDPSPAVDPDCAQVYFANSNREGTIELKPADPTSLTVRVQRVKTDEALSVPVTVVTNTDNVFRGIPEAVEFAAGSTSASFVVTFDDAAFITKYSLDLRLAGPHVDPYAMLEGAVSYTVSVQRINWLSEGPGLGQGVFTYSQFWNGTSRSTLQRVDGANMYRITDWGPNGVTLPLTPINETATRFSVPQTATGFEHPTYGDVYVEGTVEYDGGWIYVFQLDYTVGVDSFGVGRETFVLDHEVDPSSFSATITVDPAPNDAIVTVEPNEETISYITDMGSADVIGSLSDAELTETMRQYLEYLASDYNMTIDQVVSAVAQAGTYRYQADDLSPATEYVCYAYAIDLSTGRALSPVTRQSFTTLEAGQPTEDYLKYVGTWTVTSADSNNGTGPVTYTVNISQRVPNSTYYMTGWTVFPEFAEERVTISYAASTGSITIANMQDFGSAGIDGANDAVRYFMGYIPYEGDAPCMPVGGAYNAMTGAINASGAIELTGYSGELSSGGTFQIVGLDFFGRDNQYVYFFGEEGATANYGVAPYTIVRGSAASATASKNLAGIRMRKTDFHLPGQATMAFSSVGKIKSCQAK